ncbi:ABC transporter ATP-binding protein [Pyrofollis japonicus]|uniref:branched-chain amino acid ABC transporter ATP-binding protein n=1 Tax=Pyrofollis japonicus TaxID=3060460 RepID=UPI00295C14E0|nr:ABC transporter ATP-binding protein [Pyrofollis japonicus]BEP17783.1 ABC transporter ATP-binding protein [Pyrofollis japonicus]
MVDDVILRTEMLNAGYGRFHILFDISIAVRRGEIFVIVGPNGSGKSTFLKTLFGLTRIYSGKIEFEGKDITHLPPHARARLGIAYLPQTNNVFAELTVKENLYMAGYGIDRSIVEKRVQEVLEYFPILREKLSVKAKALSGGQRQLLAMAMALIRDPRLFMFDEPTAGLAPKAAKELVDRIIWLRQELGKTIVWVEQNARLALEQGDTAALLVSGRVAYSGPARELLADKELGKKYLGLKG